MKESGITQKELAERLGYKNQSSVSERLRNADSMRIDVFERFLDALGYEMEIRKK